MAKVAIMGYGTVGSGVYEILKKNAETLKHNANGEQIGVGRILDIREFPDHPEAELFTKDFNDILNDDQISVAAEVMGGLHPAYEFTKQLLEAGKTVVTSNKELVATYGPELLRTALDHGVNYLFEASVGGGIPVISPMNQCLTANNIVKIAGILNGTTNYILNEMIKNGRSFETALADAQAKGYAERNPAADIEGHDACRKIAILSSLAWGEAVDCAEIETEGITEITQEDVQYAAAMDSVIKLIGYAEKTESGEIFSLVSPMLVKRENPLAGVDGVFNAIMITGDYVGDVMFYGRGAGKLPTASAVVSDIIDGVKHKGVPKGVLWTDNGREADPDTARSFAYFIRAARPEADCLKIFPNAEIIKSQRDGETAFIAPAMNGGEKKAAFAALGENAVISAFRLLD